ncbi:MAG: GNAT family N-acetyltransferase [Gemmatimonadaceae bacterium]
MTVSIPTLTTARLMLRPFDPADAAGFAALNADPDVAQFISVDAQPISADDSWRQLAMFIGHWHLRGFGMWAVAELDRPHVLIGRIGAHQPQGWPDIEIGWALSRPHWGRGYATEGASAAMRYAFDVLQRPRIVSLIDPDNTRSRAVAERLGQRRLGDWRLRGRIVDMFGVEAETWRRLTTQSSFERTVP